MDSKIFEILQFNKCWKYFKYILEHKKNVAIECWKEKLYIHAFTHDLSKFLFCEFIPYAKYDFQNLNNNTNKIKDDFNRAWQHHKDNNKHHWDYWHERNLSMPLKYKIQMICDWKAMGRKFGNTAQEFYLRNFDKIKLQQEDRLIIERLLDLDFKHCCECDLVHWQNIKEIIESDIDYKKKYPNNYCDKLTKEWIEDINKKYNLDVLKILNYKEEDIYNKIR